MKEDTWKEVFVRQIGSGRFWKNLLQNDFEYRRFLDRSDAVYICKKAQSDAYDNVINILIKDIIVNKDSIISIRNLKDELWNDDDSALGMIKTKIK